MVVPSVYFRIGLVGNQSSLQLYLGGNAEGSRINVLYKETADEDQIIATLDPLLEAYSKKNRGETFWRFHFPERDCSLITANAGIIC